jgi:hypothetical protein
VPAFMIPVPFLVAGPADALRSDSTLNVKALTTSPPTIGDRRAWYGRSVPTIDVCLK